MASARSKRRAAFEFSQLQELMFGDSSSEDMETDTQNVVQNAVQEIAADLEEALTVSSYIL